ncbi:response regulator [Leptothrix sp. BB-4]
MSVSVAIIEDDSRVRDHVAGLIRASNLCTLAGTARDHAEGMALIADNQADVYLVDLGLPDGDGVDLIAAIRTHCQPAHSMVLSAFGDPRHIGRSMKAGATGYLLKDERAPALIDAIVALHNGESPISPQVARVLVQHVANQGLPEVPVDRSEARSRFGLQPREMEVLSLLGAGLPLMLIADRMGISHHTVNQHLRGVYRKLSVRSRAMAVHVAGNHGLLDD